MLDLAAWVQFPLTAADCRTFQPWVCNDRPNNFKNYLFPMEILFPGHVTTDFIAKSFLNSNT